MSLTITQKVQQLKAERARLQQAAAPVPQWDNTFELTPVSAPAEPQTIVTKVLGGLITIETPVSTSKVDVPVPDNSSALATQERMGELNTVIAGQSSELAQLRQAILVLAKSAKSVEDGNLAIIDGIDVIKSQTKKAVLPWKTVQNSMHKYFREIIEDTQFFNHDVKSVTAGRGLRSILSFGTAAPEAVHAAKREIFAHLKSVKGFRDKIEQNYQFALQAYGDELSTWLPTSGVFTVNTKSWTIVDILSPTFIPELQAQLYAMRGIPQ